MTNQQALVDAHYIAVKPSTVRYLMDICFILMRLRLTSSCNLTPKQNKCKTYNTFA